MDDYIHPLQVEGFRRMSPEQKLQMVEQLHAMAVQLKIAGLRMRHPDWAPGKLEHEARRSIMLAGT